MKIGDYARTKNEGIGKIIKIEPFMNNIHIFLDSKKGNITFQSKDGIFKVNNEQNIVKSSSNIIDLIEIGDYVNGYKVLNVYYDEVIESIRVGIDHLIIKDYTNQDIKSILTKEQFEIMEYKVGE